MQRCSPQLFALAVMFLGGTPTTSLGEQSFNPEYVCEGSQQSGEIGYSVPVPWRDNGSFALWASFTTPSEAELQLVQKRNSAGGIIKFQKYDIIILPEELYKSRFKLNPILLLPKEGGIYKITKISETEIDFTQYVPPLSEKARKIYGKFQQTVSLCSRT